MNKKLKFLFSALLFIAANHLFAQTIEKDIIINIDSTLLTESDWPLFNNASELNDIAYYQDISLINDKIDVSFEIRDEVWTTLERSLTKTEIPESDRFKQTVEEAGRNLSIIRTFVHPFRKNGSSWEYLQSFTLVIEYNSIVREIPETKPSVLAEGSIFRFPVAEEGFYKLSFDYINSLDGIDASSLQVNEIKALGYPGGKLWESIDRIEYVGLPEIPLYFVGDQDQTFESGEYFVLYAQGANRWEYGSGNYALNSNIYDDKNYVLLKISDEERTEPLLGSISLNDADYTTSSFDELEHIEEDNINLLFESSAHYGSGQRWYGNSLTSNSRIDLSNIALRSPVNNSTVHLNLSAAARSASGSNFELHVNNTTLGQLRLSNVSINSTTSSYASYGSTRMEYDLNNASSLDIDLEYNAISQSTGYLDYLTLNYRSNLSYRENVISGFRFSDAASLDHAISRYQLTNLPNNYVILNTTTNKDYTILGSGSNGSYEFADSSANQLKFYAVADLDALTTPSPAEKIENQDILSDVDFDLLIIYHEIFKDQVERLADHRRNHSKLNVKTVNIDKVFQEFSGGRQDPTALRNFSQYAYEVSSNYNYLLLFGGGTFDVRNVYNSSDKLSYVPTFQTLRSEAPIHSYPTDDYFGLLTAGEGAVLSSGSIDIGVGRFPVNNVEQARIVVDKLINYDTNPNGLGEWRTFSSFLADDEDNNLHFRQADDVARYVDRNYESLNVDKIYFDAFEQVSTSGGPRYPDAKDALNNHLSEGRLTLCYLGHGSYRGLSQERVIVADDIPTWNNEHKYPLFVTATCSFSAFDDPSFYSAGELTFLKEKGGSIGLFTTTRLVFSSGNKDLTDDIFANIFKRDDAGIPLRLGDVLRLAKNENIGSNTRKFSLLGDPSMRLAIPVYRVETYQINGQDYHEGMVDTVSALGSITLQGAIKDYNDNVLTDFNGEINVTVFDKEKEYTTLANDSRSSKEDFKLRKTTLFKGRAEVINGIWEISFTLPQDIDFSFGQGKIGYYAHNNVDLDAWGSLDNIIIGGINRDAPIDNDDPIVEVFMNDNSFISGGITDANPKLYVELQDDSGINISSSGLGHTPVGILDNGEEQYDLQYFYRSNLGDSRSGTILYPLNNLSPGLHTIEVTAWDLSNNSGTGMTEFLVVEDEEGLIGELFNAPNPFSEITEFSFEHTLPYDEINIKIEIFNLSGQHIKTISSNNVMLDGFRVDNIIWKGTDENGNKIQNGMYLYRLKIEPSNGIGKTFESKSKKLLFFK